MCVYIHILNFAARKKMHQKNREKCTRKIMYMLLIALLRKCHIDACAYLFVEFHHRVFSAKSSAHI